MHLSSSQGSVFIGRNAFNDGNIIEVKEINKEIRTEIKKAKFRYKRKIEAKLGSKNLREARRGMKHMTGSYEKGNRRIGLSGFSSEKQLADKLNGFNARFDVYLLILLTH